MIKLNLAYGAGFIGNEEKVQKTISDLMKYYIDNQIHKTQIDNQIGALDGASGERTVKFIRDL